MRRFCPGRSAALLAVLVFQVCTVEAVDVKGKTGRFACEMACVEKNAAFTTWRVVYPSPCPPSYAEGKNVVAWYYEPTAARRVKGPAVMCMHILSGDGSLTKSIAANFAACGLPALMPEMPLFLERIPGGDPEAVLRRPEGPRFLVESCLAGPGDMLRSADFLASRPGVDPNRLRVMGTSLGGILATTAAGRDSRFEKAAFLLAGGGLKELFSTSARPEIRPIAEAIDRADARTREKVEVALGILEPTNNAVRLSARVKAGNVRMFNVAEDEVIPPSHTRMLAKALGLREGPRYEVRPGFGHYTAASILPDLADDLAVWFGGRLPPPVVTRETETIRSVFSEVNRLLAWTPGSKGDLKVKAVATVTVGELQILRQELAFGRPASDVRTFAACFGPQASQILTVARELTACAAKRGSLGLYAHLVPIRMEKGKDGTRRVVLRHRAFTLVIDLDGTRDVPKSIHAKSGRMKVDVAVSEWNIESK